MRLVGLDLGTKTLGVSITDKTQTLVSPLKVIHFLKEDYQDALNKLEDLLKDYEVELLVLGLPKNMDGSLGFAGDRSLNFQKILESKGYKVILEDERLTTKLAENIIHENTENVKNTKGKIDSLAASLILESYLSEVQSGIKK